MNKHKFKKFYIAIMITLAALLWAAVRVANAEPIVLGNHLTGLHEGTVTTRTSVTNWLLLTSTNLVDWRTAQHCQQPPTPQSWNFAWKVETVFMGRTNRVPIRYWKAMEIPAAAPAPFIIPPPAEAVTIVATHGNGKPWKNWKPKAGWKPATASR